MSGNSKGVRAHLPAHVLVGFHIFYGGHKARRTISDQRIIQGVFPDSTLLCQCSMCHVGA